MIAKSVKELREETGLSQQKFGNVFRIPRRTLQNWESGINRIPPYYLALLNLFLTEHPDDYKEVMEDIHLKEEE